MVRMKTILRHPMVNHTESGVRTMRPKLHMPGARATHGRFLGLSSVICETRSNIFKAPPRSLPFSKPNTQ